MSEYRDFYDCGNDRDFYDYGNAKNYHESNKHQEMFKDYLKGKKENTCCCKLSLKKALEVLGCDGISEFINFSAAAFVSDFFIAGADVDAITFVPGTPANNLGTFTGALNKISPCDCDLIDITGQLFYPVPVNAAAIGVITGLAAVIDGLVATLTALLADLTTLAGATLTALIAALNALVPGLGTALGAFLTSLLTAVTTLVTTVSAILTTVLDPLLTAILSLFASLSVGPTTADLASLCQLKAIGFRTATTDAEDYEILRHNIKCVLNPGCKCNKVDCNPECDDCCCAEGVIREVATGNITGRASLEVGALAINSYEVLGHLDDALILSTPPIPAVGTTPAVPGTIFIVCADKVDFIN